MKFMIIAAESEADMAKRKEPESAAFEAYMGSWFQFSKDMQDAGIYLAGNALEAPDTATCVRVRNGTREVQDGPFTEAKEQLGGYVIVDVPDLDEAKKWAARCPAANGGAIEVRKIMLFD